MDRINQIEQYLNDPDRMARFRAQLLAALYDHDSGWAKSRNTFDWLRFAREFTAPDFEPPLESMSFFSFLLKPHFAQTWYILPRSRTWWLLRLAEDVAEPVIWLHQPRLWRRRGELARITERLNHPVCRAGDQRFGHIVRLKRPGGHGPIEWTASAVAQEAAAKHRNLYTKQGKKRWTKRSKKLPKR